MGGLSRTDVLGPLLIAACLTAIPCRGAAAEPWLTGEALRTRLAREENVFWEEAPLRQTLEKFCRAQQVAVLVDRRVDPGREIAGAAQSIAVANILQQVTERYDLGVSFFGPLVYFGPPESTARLRTLAELRREDVRRLPSAALAKLAESRPLAWDDFATPRQLLERLAREGGIEIAGLEQIPHDLWAAADLPPLTLVDRITLVAGQFDLTFTISEDGRRLTLIPLPEEVAIVRSFPAGRSPQERLSQWQSLAPDCQFRLAGDKIHVKGLVEEIERIEGDLQPGRAPSAGSPPPAAGRPSEAETRFTGRVANKPLGEVLQYLGTQLGLEIRFDRQALARAGVSLDQLVSFSVKEADGDELLEAVLKPVGCTFRRRAGAVEILPAE